MDFSIPADIQALLDECDAFIDDVIVPIEAEDDNIRFFDHRREDARTDWDRDGLPNAEWEALLGRMRREADAAGLLRYQLPARFGGRDGSNLAMAIVREHLARRGLGLHNDLQNESSIIGNFPTVLMMEKYGSEAQQQEWIPKMLAGEARIGFGLTEPLHGSDATWMETTAVRDGVLRVPLDASRDVPLASLPAELHRDATEDVDALTTPILGRKKILVRL